MCRHPARSIDAGASVYLLLVTSGDKGCADASADPAAVAAQGEAEAQEAARRFGLTEVVFLLQPDGDVEDTRALRGELVLWIRRGRPAVLFTHDPEQPDSPYLAHHRHRIVGRVALDAVYPFAGDPLSFPEQVRAGLAPHAVTKFGCSPASVRRPTSTSPQASSVSWPPGWPTKASHPTPRHCRSPGGR